MLKIRTKPSLYRDFALLSALIIFVLFLVTLWITYKTYQNHSKDMLQRLENDAVRIDRALIIEIERSAYLLESIGRQINVNESVDIDKLKILLQSFSKGNHLLNSEFYWINQNHQIILGSQKGVLEKPIDVSDRDYVKRAITAPWEIHIGQPVEGRVSHKWVMPVAMGLTNRDGDFIGTINISLDIATLSKEISEVIKEPDINFAVTNTAFTLLTEISSTRNFFQQHFDLSVLTTIDFARDPSGVYSMASLWNLEKIYAYYERSSEYPYIIFVGYDAQTSRRDIIAILIPRLFQIFIISVFLILTLWTVRKRIIKPVVTLQEHTANILQGGSFSHHSDTDPIEIEQLSKEIERISHYVQERRRIERELVLKNAELMKIRESAEATNHLKARFFEQIGDALLEPLKHILESAESMRNELFGPLSNAKYQELTEQIAQKAQAITNTLIDVTSISRTEAGLLSLAEAPADLIFIIKKSIRIVREDPALSELNIIIDVDEGVPNMLVDELRLTQLLVGIIANIAADIDAQDPIRLQLCVSQEDVSIDFFYKPAQPTGRMDNKPLTTTRNTLSDYTSGTALNHVLADLIIAMHQGRIINKSMPDRIVKKSIILPTSRLIGHTVANISAPLSPEES